MTLNDRDGTLITQRLHFVPLPHPYRHVLGWFRLVKELQEHNVSALCVFDGRERNIAKAKEVRLLTPDILQNLLLLQTLKRQEAKKLASAREVIENDRLKRLTDIGLLLNSLRALDAFGKSRVAGMIRDATHENEVPAILLPEYYVPTSGMGLNLLLSSLCNLRLIQEMSVKTTYRQTTRTRHWITL